MKSFIVSGLASLMMLFPNIKEQKLDDVAKPYLGEYECQRAQLGSMDCLKRFSYIRLELKDEDNFTLYYQEKGERKKQVNGKYSYNKEKKSLTLEEKSGLFKREFPLSDGILTVSFPIGERTLVLEFVQK